MKAALRCALLAAALVLPALAAPTAMATVQPRSAGLETGDFSEFDQATAATGSLNVSTERAASGSRSALAAYAGGGANGYARGVFNVDWPDGSDVDYSGSFYLPPGFKQAMQGQVVLMRWDNWPTYGNPGADAGGIAIYGSDKRARLVRSQYGGAQVSLIGPFDLPEGRWFTLSVHQRLSLSNPYSEVRLDGQLIGASTAQNSYGRTIERLRVGLVAIGASQQLNPLTLWFDDAGIADGTAPLTQPAPPPPPPSNAPPTVAIANPSDGASVRRTLSASASATDDHGVARVEFRIDGNLKRTDTTAPWDWTWDGARWLSTGKHTLSVRAYDAAGLSAADSITFMRIRG